MQSEEFTYHYGGSTNLLEAVHGIGQTTNRDYSYDANGNLLTDDFRNITSTQYGRAAYAFHLTKENDLINYLYSNSDMRIFKEVITPTETTQEYYLTDILGKVVAIQTSIIPANDVSPSSDWEYYLHGTEREARIKPFDSETEIAADEIHFYITDHLGNTRINYMPQIDAQGNTAYVFNDDFTSASNWQVPEESTTTISYSNNQMTVSEPSGDLDRIYKTLQVEAGVEYTISLDAATINNASDLTLTIDQDMQNSSTVNILVGSFGQGTSTFTYTASETETIALYIAPNQASSYVMNSIKVSYLSSTLVYCHLNYVADYFPYGKTLREYVGTTQERYLTTQHERDAETGLDYRGARFYDSDVARFLSTDPWANKYPSWSTYNYVMGNPIVFVDPSGKAVAPPSTHIDEHGNVIAVYDDGDLTVYQHKNVEIENAQKSGGKLSRVFGKRVGVTLDINSFQGGDKIDLKSKAAENWINNFELSQRTLSAQLPFRFQRKLSYALGARNGFGFDPKSYMKNGSQISDGVYVSPRDLGNYAAGAFGRINALNKKGLLLQYGAFNLSRNNFGDFVSNNSKYINMAKGFDQPETTEKTYGENYGSSLFQRLGYEGIRTIQDFNSKYSKIWAD